MLVSKREVEINHQKFKQFKKFSLELHQKQYHVYENELILTTKPKKTNQKVLDLIHERLPVDETTKPVKAVKFKVKGAEEKPDNTLLRKFDINYHQSVNIALSEKVGFHINANIQSKNDFGLYSMSPALSYRVQDTYYRLGLTWGPQMTYYMMASKKFSTNWSVGVLVSLLEKSRLSKSKVITTIRYKNNLFYGCLGYQNMLGLKTYPIYNDNLKVYLNPYYGKEHLEGCSSGLSKNITDNTKLNLELTCTPWIIQLKSSLLLKVNEWVKLFLAYELQNTNAFVSFGFKMRNFYLGFPLLNLDLTNKEHTIWVTPLVFGMVGLSLFWDKIRQKLPFNKKKGDENSIEGKLDKRQKEIKLISRRVREIFNEEVRKNGLVIVEAYYGQRDLIEQLIEQPVADRIRSTTSPTFLHKVIDITDSLRFYVDSSKLHLPKGSKSELYGLYQLELSDNRTPDIYIKYTYQGEEKEKFFPEIGAINLP